MSLLARVEAWFGDRRDGGRVDVGQPFRRRGDGRMPRPVRALAEAAAPLDMMPGSRVIPRRVLPVGQRAALADGVLGAVADPAPQAGCRVAPGEGGAIEDVEIIAELLATAVGRQEAGPLAGALVRAFGDLRGMAAATDERLLRVDGMRPRACRQLRAAEAFAHRMGQARFLNRNVLETWDDLVRYCRTIMAHDEVERFHVFFLDRRNAVIADETLAKGTIDHVAVYPREVARRALEWNASAVILAHNHPSGDPTPSLADVAMTGQVSRACQTIGITVHDHLVIGHDTEVSFRDEGFL